MGWTPPVFLLQQAQHLSCNRLARNRKVNVIVLIMANPWFPLHEGKILLQKTRLDNAGLETAGGSPEAFKTLIANEAKMWSEVIRKTGAKLD